MAKNTRELGRALLRNANERKADPKEIWGIPWGIRSLDKLTGGIHREQFMVLGAAPSVGKTAFLCQVAMNVATWARAHDAGVARIISTEMSAESLLQRMAFAYDALEVERLRTEDPTRVIRGLTQQKVDSGFITDAEYARYKQALFTVGQLPIEIEDNPGSPEASRHWLEDDGHCVWFGLDYLQKHPTGQPGLSGEDVRGAQFLSGEFQKIAQNVVPGLVLSSLNSRIREREGHRPELYDLYGGAKVAHDATIAAFLHWPDFWEKPTEVDEKKPRFMQLIIAKNRKGRAPVEFELLFSPANYAFSDRTKNKETVE